MFPDLLGRQRGSVTAPTSIVSSPRASLSLALSKMPERSMRLKPEELANRSDLDLQEAYRRHT